MSTTIAYTRVSTDEQTASGLGLDAQRQAIEAAADRLGLSVSAWYADEAVSGAAPIDKRLGLLRAIEAVGSATPRRRLRSATGNGSTLIVAKRDRLARDALLSAWIEKEIVKRGGRIVSAAGEGTDNDEPTGILMRRIVDAFAEYERLVIRARTKAAMRIKRSRGERVGSIPYGYRLAGDDVRLIEVAREQAAIRLIVQMRGAGSTYRAICAELHRRGVPPKSGDRWHPKVVRAICARAEAESAASA
jgi:DNA invertase Pin-like site-specific DNA recombinase